MPSKSRAVLPADLWVCSGMREWEMERTSFSEEGDGDREVEVVEEGMASYVERDQNSLEETSLTELAHAVP
jgi:hypothetical protein